MQKYNNSADKDGGVLFFLKKVNYSIGMLKKVTAIILALFIINVSLFAQLSEEAIVVSSVEEEPVDNLITQHIKWREVNHAREYEIEVQHKTEGGWIDSGSWITEETEYDLRLEAGSYRFRLSAINAIGRKGSPSAWAEFDVIDEEQPYLRAVQKSERYNVSAIERSIDDENGRETITIRGVHCFGEGCVFKLEPCTDEALVQTFKAFDRQKEVILPVVESDSSSGVIKLTVDWSMIAAGFYNLTVTNSVGLTDSLPVLMLPDKQPMLVSKDTAYDDIMQADFLDAASGLTKLSFDASAIQQDSAYGLVPVSNAENEYPFETSYGRVRQDASLNSYDDGVLSLNVNASLLKSGWYDVIAETPGVETGTQRIFVQTDMTPGSIPEIKSISTKFNTDRRSVTFTVKLDEPFFSEGNDNQLKLSLVSEKNEYGEFTRNILRQTSVARNGKSADFEIMASSVYCGINALMFETPDGMRLSFITIKSDYKTEETELSDLEIRECFLRAPSDTELTAREERFARNGAGGAKYAEYLPAFQSPYGKWYIPPSGRFPGKMEEIESGLSFSVVNNVEKTPYEINYLLRDEETLNMLCDSEGISFQSMITNRNNGWTKWYLDIHTSEGDVSITIPRTYRQLTQTVVIWADYQINPETILELSFRVHAKYPEASGWENTLEIYEAKTYSSSEPFEELRLKIPHTLSKAGVLAAFYLDSDDQDSSDGYTSLPDDRVDDIIFPSHIYLNVFDTRWLSVNATYIPEGWGSHAMIGGELTLAIPNDWFEPYVGAGIMFGKDSRWEPLFAGVVLFNWVNVRWTYMQKATTLAAAGLVSPDSANADNVAWKGHNWLEVGIEVPLRKTKGEFIKASLEEDEKTPVFFTDLLINTAVYSDEDLDEGAYLKTLPDFSFGCRVVNLKYMALDVTAGTHNFMLGDELSLGSYDFAGGLKFKLPLFNESFTPYIGVDYGYLLHQDDDEDSMYFSSKAGIKFGKHVSLSINSRFPESSWDRTWELIEVAPLLAPVTCVMSCTDWRLDLEISIPLRDK